MLLAMLAAFYVIGLNRDLVNAAGAGLIARYGILKVSVLMLLGGCVAEPAPSAEPG